MAGWTWHCFLTILQLTKSAQLLSALGQVVLSTSDHCTAPGETKTLPMMQITTAMFVQSLSSCKISALKPKKSGPDCKTVRL